MSLANTNNVFIDLTGSFAELEVNDVLLNEVTCDEITLVNLGPTQVTETAKLSSFTITNSTLDNSFKLIKYTSSSGVGKIEISDVTINGGTKLPSTTLFSIEGTVPNLDITTVLFDASTEIGDSRALD